jgi:recombination protein RecA
MSPVERDERQERERIKAVDLAVGQIEKQFGKGSIMRLGGKGAIQPIDAISTGAISIDYALGVVACRAAASSRSSGPSHRARRRSRCR